MSKFTVRRATPSDYNGVLDISRHSADYMPTMFYELLLSGRHLVYVAETVDDHKVVGLLVFRLEPDGKTVIPMSGRVRPEFQRRGIFWKMWLTFHEQHQQLTSRVFDGPMTPLGSKAFKDATKLYLWNFIAFRIPNIELRCWSSSPPVSRIPSLTPLQLTHSDIERLASDDRLPAFLRRFSTDYIPGAAPTWEPASLDERGIRNQLKTSTQSFVTLNPSDSELHAVSFESSFALKSQGDGHVAADVFFFGGEVDDLFDHVTAHLRHLANVVTTVGDLVLQLHFPLSVERSVVERGFDDGSWPRGMSGGGTQLLNQMFLARKSML